MQGKEETKLKTFQRQLPFKHQKMSVHPLLNRKAKGKYETKRNVCVCGIFFYFLLLLVVGWTMVEIGNAQCSTRTKRKQ